MHAAGITCSQRLGDLIAGLDPGDEAAAAEVIRVAALHDGMIDREQVYEICGYEDDRMLRGFTLPTSRITRDLQEEGIVAEGVEPVLTTIYLSGVKAAAFRIPAEMAAILTTDRASEAVE